MSVCLYHCSGVRLPLAEKPGENITINDNYHIINSLSSIKLSYNNMLGADPHCSGAWGTGDRLKVTNSRPLKTGIFSIRRQLVRLARQVCKAVIFSVRRQFACPSWRGFRSSFCGIRRQGVRLSWQVARRICKVGRPSNLPTLKNRRISCPLKSLGQTELKQSYE